MSSLKDIEQLKLEYQNWLKSRPHSLSVFPDKLRNDIMTFVDAGRNAEVCRVLGIPSSTVSNWRQKKRLVSVVKPSAVSNIKSPAQQLTYSKIAVPTHSSKQDQKSILAEMDFSTATRKVSLKFHDQNCLEKAIAVLLGRGDER